MTEHSCRKSSWWFVVWILSLTTHELSDWVCMSQVIMMSCGMNTTSDNSWVVNSGVVRFGTHVTSLVTSASLRYPLSVFNKNSALIMMTCDRSTNSDNSWVDRRRIHVTSHHDDLRHEYSVILSWQLKSCRSIYVTSLQDDLRHEYSVNYELSLRHNSSRLTTHFLCVTWLIHMWACCVVARYLWRSRGSFPCVCAPFLAGKQVMSHLWMGHVTYMNLSYHNSRKKLQLGACVRQKCQPWSSGSHLCLCRPPQVCVCVWEREREREIETETERERGCVSALALIPTSAALFRCVCVCLCVWRLVCRWVCGCVCVCACVRNFALISACTALLEFPVREKGESQGARER